MSKKPGFTLQQHEDIGRQIHTMCDQLTDIQTETNRAYLSELSNLAVTALTAISELRSALDNKVRLEHPDKADSHRIYYRTHRNDHPGPV